MSKHFMAKHNSPAPTAAPPPPGKQATLAGACDKAIIEDNKALRDAVEAQRGGRPLVTLILRDGVLLTPHLIPPLYEVLKARGHVKELDLWLHTLGGQTEVPWQVVSLVREFCDKFTVVVPKDARSAGTHISLGADSLILGPLSTLGPVDPTTQHALLPRDANGNTIPVSVEDLKHCIRFISNQLKAQEIEGKDPQRYSPADMATIVGHIFEHINPLAIGAVERAYELSRMITRRVLETHLDPVKDKDKITNIADKIGGGFYSHHFPLTRRDVENDLGLAVESAPEDFWSAVEKAQAYYTANFDNQLVAPGAAGQRPAIFVLAGFVESAGERRVLVHAEIPPTKPDAKDGQMVQRWVRPTVGPRPNGGLFDIGP